MNNDKSYDIKCSRCKHFFITWEANTPHGCKIYGIKSKKQPSQIVFESSGKPCMGFEPKNIKKDPYS